MTIAIVTVQGDRDTDRRKTYARASMGGESVTWRTTAHEFVLLRAFGTPQLKIRGAGLATSLSEMIQPSAPIYASLVRPGRQTVRATTRSRPGERVRPGRTESASHQVWRWTREAALEGGSATSGGVIRGGQQQQEERPFGLVSGCGPGRFRSTHDNIPFAYAYAPPPRRSPALLQDDFESRKSTGHCDPANHLAITKWLQPSAWHNLPAPAFGR